jgi:hypothetical protein
MAAVKPGAFVRLRDGAWLDRRRIGAAVSVLLALQLAGLLFIAAGTHGWIVPLDKPTTTDFVSFYAAGKLADAGTPALAYDHTAHLAAEERVAGAGIGYQYFNYPPVYLLPFAALAALPYLAAFLLFEIATLLLYLLVASHILGDRSATALVALGAVPIVFWNFGLGQNGFLTAALFGAATLLIDRRPVAAGLLFGALCYKPQFALVVPLALAAGGYWRAFAAAAASAGVIVLASLALFGIAPWHAWLGAAAASPAMYQSGRILFAGMANIFGAARLLGAPPAIAYLLQAAMSLAAATVAVVVWRRNLSLPIRAATLAAASLVAAPLSLLYDLLLGVVAACWLVRDRAAPAAAGWETVALAALYLVLLDGRGLAEHWHVPAYPLAAIALFVIAATRAWREAVQRRAAGDPQRSKTKSGLLAREQQISM